MGSPLRGKATREGALLAREEVEGFTKIGDGECVDGNDNTLYGLGKFRTKTAAECADLCSRDFEDSVLVGFMLINSSVRQDYCRCLEGGEKIASVQDKQDNI